MFTLIIVLSFGTFQVPADTLEACQSAGFNMLHHDDQAEDRGFLCVDGYSGVVWSSVDAH